MPLLMLVASSGAAFGAFRLVRADGDRVEVLGSGADVSIRVTTGRAELLIATGTDRTAFGNAYARVSVAPRSQPDVLLLAGSNRSLNVPTFATDAFPGSIVYAIHPMDAEATGVDDLSALAPLPRNPLRFTLDERIVVVVESVPIEGEDGFAWRALISRDRSRIAVLSSLAHEDLFTWTDPVSVVVPAGGASFPVGLDSSVAAIVGPAAALDLDVPAEGAEQASHVVPVRPGSIATMTFVDAAIELTSDDRTYKADRRS